MPRIRCVLDRAGIAASHRLPGTGLADPVAGSKHFWFDASARYIGGGLVPARLFPRLVIVVGGVVRLAYGLHALVAPEAMGERRLAPLTHGRADPRLSLRGFGGQLVVIGAFNLCAS